MKAMLALKPAYAPGTGYAYSNTGFTVAGMMLEKTLGKDYEELMQKRIFEPFYRSTQQRRFPQGLGLGLSIARDSVAAHGGTLTYANNPTGGAIFTIELTKKETF